MIQTAGLNALGPQSPVLMYKTQGIQLDENASSLLAVDFVLGLQTVEQSAPAAVQKWVYGNVY